MSRPQNLSVSMQFLGVKGSPFDKVRWRDSDFLLLVVGVSTEEITTRGFTWRVERGKGSPGCMELAQITGSHLYLGQVASRGRFAVTPRYVEMTGIVVWESQFLQTHTLKTFPGPRLWVWVVFELMDPVLVAKTLWVSLLSCCHFGVTRWFNLHDDWHSHCTLTTATATRFLVQSTARCQATRHADQDYITLVATLSMLCRNSRFLVPRCCRGLDGTVNKNHSTPYCYIRHSTPCHAGRHNPLSPALLDNDVIICTRRQIYHAPVRKSAKVLFADRLPDLWKTAAPM